MSNNNTSLSETYSNLNKLIKILENENIDPHLVESVKIAQKALLSLELMGIASSYKKDDKV